MIGLKIKRKEKHLSQQALANKLNIAREAISYYESGKREPTLDMLIRMSEVLNASIDYLITGKEFITK